MNSTHAIQLRDCFRSYWRAEPDCPVWLWAENNIVLSSLESADMAGPFSSAVTPFIREPLECFRDPSVSEVSLVFATQVCKTLMLMVGVAYWIEHNAGRVIWVMDTENNARSFSETRWQPFLRDSLPHLLPSNRDEFKKLQQRLGQCIIHFVGSNSPGNLSSRPADLVIMDEVDKFAVTSSREANAVDLVEQRTKSRSNTKIIKTSSPTTEDGLIWKSYQHGDQRQFHVACPHCAAKYRMEFEHVRWDQDARTARGWNYLAVRNTSRYICPACSIEIHDGHKTAMLRSAAWLPSNDHAAPGVRSYQLTSLYSPWSKTTFGALAVEFLKHKARFDMKGWDNGYMARPTSETCKKLDWEELAARREPYAAPIPAGVALLTAFCDVQDSWLEFGVIGWGEGTENWLVEHELIHGDPSKRGVWDDLAAAVTRRRGLPIEWTFIDYGGHHGQEGIEFARRMASQRVYLSRGSNQNEAPVNHKITKTKKPIVRLFETGVGNAKRKIMSMLSESDPGPGYCHFPDWLEDEAFKQLCAEELRVKFHNGAPEEYWFQTRPRNEMLDIYVGCYAALCRLNQGTIRRRIAEMRARNKEPQKNRAASVTPPADPPPIRRADQPMLKHRPANRPRKNWVNNF